MQIPEHIQKLATAAGLEVHGWLDDEPCAIVQSKAPSSGAVLAGRGMRPDVSYVGTKQECVAFLTAWSQCIEHKLIELVEPLPDNRVRVTTLPVGQGDQLIQPGQSAEYANRPQRGMFRGEKIAIPTACAKRFEILNIRCGVRSTFEAAGPIPGEMFAMNVEEYAPFYDLAKVSSEQFLTMTKDVEERFGRAWDMPPCHVAMDLAFTVRNTSDLPWPFVALVLGKSATR